jgi:four helix bundle protein
MQSPEKLRVFSEAEDLAIGVYRIAGALPSIERYGLSQQIRRAAVSIGSNIAEGCGRGSGRELARFLEIALGSTAELEFQLRLAHRLGYLGSADHLDLRERARRIQRMLIRLITRVRPALETYPRPAVNR